MKIGTTLMAALLASVAFASVASADTVCPTAGTCVIADGSTYGSGSCDAATYYSEYNQLYVYSYDTPAGYVSGGVFTSCYAYNFWGPESGSSIGASAYSADNGYAGAYWYGYEYSGGSGCGSYAYANTAATGYVFEDLGCNAGAPPAVPAVLP